MKQPGTLGAALLEELADEVARRVLDGLRAGRHPSQVDQHASPLGPRRHCAAVRRRLAAGLAGGTILGRRLLLTPEAVEEELASSRVKRPAPDAESDVRDLAKEMGLRLVPGGHR